MEDCLFCKIRDGAIPSKKVYEDDAVLAFEDIEPKAPVHVLIIPKQHVASVMDLEGGHCEAVCAMMEAAREIAKEQGLDASGFRLVINTGGDGGQTVGHLHMHLLGGRRLKWPPG